MLRHAFALIAASAIAAPAAFAESFIQTDDRDLSPGGPRATNVPLVLEADDVRSEPAESGLSIQVTREVHGADVPVAGLQFSLGVRGGLLTGTDGTAVFENCTPGERMDGTASLRTQHFAVTDGSRAYSIRFRAICGEHTNLRFVGDSNGAQALGIWDAGYRAEVKLGAAVGLGFWDSTLNFVWPANGDYYSWGRVHVTRGDHWDIVGHELGHGIYDLAAMGAFGGGQHRIDECYSHALALSEGWASYFSAWLYVDLADADAKFEFLVPRRAPIRFEHVPADVCNGPTNEWRVTGFLWDLIDLNRDGEELEAEFARVWNTMAGRRSRSVDSAASLLQAAGFDSALLDLVWELNFRSTRGSSSI